MMMHQIHVPNPLEICEVVDLVTSTLLATPAIPISTPSSTSGALGDRVWTGFVAITGPFSGAVTVACSSDFVEHARAAMVDERNDDASRDVLAELTNVIGGNIKSLLSSSSETHCHLSLPIVSIGTLEMPAATLVHEQWCQCEDERIVVSLWRAQDPTNGRQSR